MILATRPGAQILIPLEHREQFRAMGCSFADAPSGYVEVTTPTPLSEAVMLSRAIPAASPSTEVPTATEPAAPAQRQKRRGRGPGD